jgi:SAM-dependent methyltransferase
MPKDVSHWDKAYKNEPYEEKEPHPGVVDLQEILQANDVHSILDLGCGDGRHLVHLAGKGFRVFGLDLSFQGLLRSRQWLAEEGHPARLVQADAVALPWTDGSFDALISIQVLNHNLFEDIRRTANEIRRVLRPGGLLFITVAKAPPHDRWYSGKYEQVEPGTFVPQVGFESGVAHHFFTEGELRILLGDFVIQELGIDSSTGKHFRVRAKKRLGWP